ncbi:poly(3-hydroxyalkanoate) depolymerase [Amycolatopsis antarctica]|uniref:Poly(3-hydroxyalkanoate) depolymerase n=1 Tax=Amycolatopsis antarctica TaxID=1854586 RepID=A0A263D2T1_9PSEU|nr:alpha/beta fold hydrolase [Amycolatopsis antarctica]OZM71786.1 poly(3-hydroxyalkanoate) depolymerase [Amycolatopsis antarctica]
MSTAARRPRQASTVAVRGRKLAVTHHPGAAGRVPLVLCNGIGSSQRLFDPVVGALDRDRPLILFDVPGLGGSAAPRVPYLFSTLAAALHRVIAGFGYRSADVLGISWGGGLAQQYAFQYRRRCRRLVLVATGTGMLMVPAAPRTLARMSTPRRHRDPAYAERIAGDLYGGSARLDPARTISALHNAPTATPRRAYLYQLMAIAGWSSLPFLPLIRQPALVLAGTDDPIIPPVNASMMAGLLPRGRLHRYDGGHLALLTEAGELAPVIDSFLDEDGDERSER